MPGRTLIALAVAAATLALPAVATAEPAAASSRVVAVDGLEVQVLARVNAVRRAHGLQPLRANAALASVAAAHSSSMARNGFFAHESSDGSEFWKRVKARYGSGGYRTWSVGENLAWAAPGMSAAQAVTMWLNSPPHRANLLSPKWREIGLGGVHANAAGGVFGGLEVTILTADFGART